MANIIAIHSYRGGTGKSNLTANLAVAIARCGFRVAVVDTDLQSPGIHVLFQFEETSHQPTLNDFLWGRQAISETAYDVSAIASISEPGCLFLVPASMNPDEIARILSEGYSVSLLSDGFRRLVRDLQLDYLLIDTHPGLSRETLLSIAISTVLLLILRPDHQDFQGTAVTIDVARQLKVRRLMLVLNKALPKMDFEALQDKIERIYSVPVAGIFPLSEDMIQLGSSGLFCLHHPDHLFTQVLNRVAAQLMT
jgi:MinD-like ATPase involved in chromosome partitioning or flagellar assembly